MIGRDTPLPYDYLNSFAVELNDVGRTEEARNVINLVLSTPFVRHYSNWTDTGKDVYRKSGCGANFRKRASPCDAVFNPMQPALNVFSPHQRQ